MELYKGEVKDDSSINWIDPTPLAPNKQAAVIKNGEIIFKNNCASCHAVAKDITGPALIHSCWAREGDPTYKRISNAFIHNPANTMVSVEAGYFRCMKNRFGGVVMTSFPLLNDSAIDDIYAYIKNEGNRLQLPKPAQSWYSACHDSCLHYQQVKHGIITKRDSLIADNEPLAEGDYGGIGTKVPLDIDTTVIALPAIDSNLEFVIPKESPATYYQFNIQNFGWYNIDMMMKAIPGITNGQLSVQVTGSYQDASFNIFIIIPEIKVFAEGGLLNDGKNEYGFYTKDGQCPLLPGAKAYIIAMGEEKDEIVFGETVVTLQERQNLQLELKKITRKEFDKAIKAMNLDSSLTIQEQDSKNADAIK